jgi:hypothetical protein
LGELMTEDHTLRVFDGTPLVGCEVNVGAWRGYSERFPRYIYPHRIAHTDGTVAILGHTTGSHLGLSDAEESRLTLIWVAEIVAAAVRSWSLIDDSLHHRRRRGLEATSKSS